MVRPLGEVLQTIGGYGFHIYDDGGARWITIRYETDDFAKKANALSGVDVVIQSLGVSPGPEVIFRPTRFFSKATRLLVPRWSRLTSNG